SGEKATVHGWLATVSSPSRDGQRAAPTSPMWVPVLVQPASSKVSPSGDGTHSVRVMSRAGFSQKYTVSSGLPVSTAQRRTSPAEAASTALPSGLKVGLLIAGCV